MIVLRSEQTTYIRLCGQPFGGVRTKGTPNITFDQTSNLTLHEFRLHGRLVLLGGHDGVELGEPLRPTVVDLAGLDIPG